MTHAGRLLFRCSLAVACLRATDSRTAEPARCTLKTLAAVELPMRDAGPLVPVTVDGRPAWLVLHTNDGITTFLPTAVAELGLHTEALSPDLEAKSDGKAVKFLASIQSFTIGSLRLPKKFAWVDPSSESPSTTVIEGRLCWARSAWMYCGRSTSNWTPLTANSTCMPRIAAVRAPSRG
jgi:hypothetical protein